LECRSHYDVREPPDKLGFRVWGVECRSHYDVREPPDK